jgi:hypothetical protein
MALPKPNPNCMKRGSANEQVHRRSAGSQLLAIAGFENGHDAVVNIPALILPHSKLADLARSAARIINDSPWTLRRYNRRHLLQ